MVVEPCFGGFRSTPRTTSCLRLPRASRSPCYAPLMPLSARIFATRTFLSPGAFSSREQCGPRPKAQGVSPSESKRLAFLCKQLRCTSEALCCPSGERGASSWSPRTASSVLQSLLRLRAYLGHGCAFAPRSWSWCEIYGRIQKAKAKVGVREREEKRKEKEKKWNNNNIVTEYQIIVPTFGTTLVPVPEPTSGTYPGTRVCMYPSHPRVQGYPPDPLPTHGHLPARLNGKDADLLRQRPRLTRSRTTRLLARRVWNTTS